MTQLSTTSLRVCKHVTLRNSATNIVLWKIKKLGTEWAKGYPWWNQCRALRNMKTDKKTLRPLTEDFLSNHICYQKTAFANKARLSFRTHDLLQTARQIKECFLSSMEPGLLRRFWRSCSQHQDRPANLSLSGGLGPRPHGHGLIQILYRSKIAMVVHTLLYFVYIYIYYMDIILWCSVSLKYPIGTSKMGAPRHCNERAEGEKKTDSCYGSKARSKRQKANQTTRRLTRGSWLPCQKRPELRWKGSNHEAEREKITPMWNRQAASSSLVSMALRALGFDEKPNVKVEKVKARPRMAHCQRTHRAVGGRPARSHVSGQ